MNLVDVPQVLTQILGFLLMVWILRRYAWGPVIGMLEARREKIAGEFKEGERLKAEAMALKARYDAELKTIDAQARANTFAMTGASEKALLRLGRPFRKVYVHAADHAIPSPPSPRASSDFFAAAAKSGVLTGEICLPG